MLITAHRGTLPPHLANDNRALAWSRLFHGDGRDFSASRQAEQFARDHGFCVGSMQADSPRGLMHGYDYVAKWRNLSFRERAQLHGTLTGDGRYGPVMMVVLSTAPFEALVALSAEIGASA